jgi:hypothetical protein
MTERERWIVYPLLFLALGAALRDKVFGETKNKRIECQELIVSGDDDASVQPVPLVRIGSVPRPSAESPHVGQIVVNGEVIVSGQLAAPGIQAEQLISSRIQADQMQTRDINAANYFFRRLPFAPMQQAIPGMSTEDLLRAQQHVAGEEQDEAAADALKQAEEPTKAAEPKAKSAPEATEKPAPPAE